MDRVKLINMVFYGYHGVVEQEKVLGGKYEVDVEFEFDMTSAIKTDHLRDTISYEEIYQLVQDVVTHSKFHLIEALAGKLLRVIFNTYPVDLVLVRIRKPNAPVKGVLDTIEVEISRTREEMRKLL